MDSSPASPPLFAPATPQQRRRRLIGGAIVVLLFFGLPLLNNSTELTPGHDDTATVCFSVAGVIGVLCAGLAFRGFREARRLPRLGVALWFGFMASLVAALVSFSASELVENAIDFPIGRTTTYDSVLTISRAYHADGKNSNWHIQTTPLWSDLTITSDDYEFMLDHRGPGDDGSDPDRVASKGRFCARVTLGRSGNALRVMHAGWYTLPAGTVILCPTGP